MTASADPMVPSPEPRILTIGEYKRLAKIDPSRLANINDLFMVVVGLNTMTMDGVLMPPEKVGQSHCWDKCSDLGLQKTLRRAQEMCGVNDEYVVW
jgi:hypothetical protein